MSGLPEKEWDWVAFMDLVSGMAVIAMILDQLPMNDTTRLVCVERIASDARESAQLAEVLVARAKVGDRWW